VGHGTTTLTTSCTHTPVYRYEFADRDAPVYLPFRRAFARRVPRGRVPYLFRDQEFLDTAAPEQEELSDTMIRY